MNPKLILVVLVGALVFYVAALLVAHYSMALYSTLTLLFVSLSLLPLFVEMGKSEDEELEEE